MSATLCRRLALAAGFRPPAALTTLTATARRGIAGKATREEIDKPPPFPYWKKEFRSYHALFDRCTLRFDENTKIIVVEGAHGVGKSKFAQELAEELDMK